MESSKKGGSGDLGPPTLVVAWSFSVISTLVVALRFYVRLGIQRKFKIDDYMIIITLLCVMGMSAFLTVAVSWGAGKHIEAFESNPSDAKYAIKWVYLDESLAIMTPLFGRVSYVLLLSNIMPPCRFKRILLWVLIAVHFVVDIVALSLSLAQCRPFRGYWDKSTHPNCWPFVVQIYAVSVQIWSVVDLVLAAFPCSLFWNLSLHWKQKVFLSSIMGFGVFAMIASIIKTIELKNLKEEDLTFSMLRIAICSVFEAHLVLLSASLPTVIPIFKTPRNLSDDRCGRADNLNTFLSWKQAQAGTPGGNRGPFKPLGELTLATRISCDGAQKVPQAEMYTLRGMDGDDTHDDMTGIRKDIRVSITFDQGHLSGQTQHRASGQAWRTGI
ncbi:hypothetical protein K445DRAFT_363824 [Daldinia sp. EC12]|nr:hypothetical protein F4774DRAFT_420361 [Daldinia eschscholtzii]OTB19487.1 hypothetical protein K445DRAFT_363824 [Daldinia sp. EC12]